MSPTNTPKILNVNPKLASAWLQNRYAGQRKVRTTHVHKLATDMKQGKWKLSNDAITFVGGKLMNGQHRCEAIVLANVEVPMLVLHADAENETIFESMDSGLTRTVEDTLLQHGFKYSMICAAAARWVVGYNMGMIGWSNVTSKKKSDDPASELDVVISRGQIIQYCLDNRARLERYAKFVLELYIEKKILYPSQACAFLMIANKTGEKKAMGFVAAIYNGTSNDISFDFRERLIKNNMSKAKVSRFYMFGLMIKAYNMFLKGQRNKLMAGAKEDFPLID